MDLNEADPMRAALAKAAEQFRFYATEHRRKVTEGTVEGSAATATIRKAEVNDQMARMCDAALGIDVDSGATGEVIFGHPLANTIINFLSETKDGMGCDNPTCETGCPAVAITFATGGCRYEMRLDVEDVRNLGAIIMEAANAARPASVN